MWFKKIIQKSTFGNTSSVGDTRAIGNTHCQAKLASIQSNGVELAMPELLHYQNKTALIDLAARKHIHGQMSGNYLSRNKGKGMEFDEVRHYQTGDDIRAIDWRVTARTGKTHTKLFREELERPVLIATDLSASMHFGSQLLFKSIQAAHVASLVAWHAKNRGDRLGGIVFNQFEHIELKPRSRKEGVLHYLHALTTSHQQQHQNDSQHRQPHDNNYFSSNCARIRQIAKPGSLVYLITDAQVIKSANNQQQQDALRHLTQIGQHCELVVCLISDPLEQSLPSSKVKLNVTMIDVTMIDVTMIDNANDNPTRQQLTLGDKATAEHYHQQALNISEQCTNLLTKAGARVINFSAGETLEQQLKDGAQFCNQ